MLTWVVRFLYVFPYDSYSDQVLILKVHFTYIRPQESLLPLLSSFIIICKTKLRRCVGMPSGVIGGIWRLASLDIGCASLEEWSLGASALSINIIWKQNNENSWSTLSVLSYSLWYFITRLSQHAKYSPRISQTRPSFHHNNDWWDGTNSSMQRHNLPLLYTDEIA